MKFYKCMHCGNVAVKVHDAGVPLVCCGEKMKELIAGESDGAADFQNGCLFVRARKVYDAP